MIVIPSHKYHCYYHVRHTNTQTYTPGVVLSECDSDPADTVAGLHVSILHRFPELLLQGQHWRHQLQQSVHISTSPGHTNTDSECSVDYFEPDTTV